MQDFPTELNRSKYNPSEDGKTEESETNEEAKDEKKEKWIKC